MKNECIIDSDRNKRWYQNNLVHRDNDEPTVIDSNGDKLWYQNNLLHRDHDKPAVIYNSGTKEWYQNGVLHRDNGAAVEYFNGTKYWCIVEKEYSEEEYWRRIKLLVFI